MIYKKKKLYLCAQSSSCQLLLEKKEIPDPLYYNVFIGLQVPIYVSNF